MPGNSRTGTPSPHPPTPRHQWSRPTLATVTAEEVASPRNYQSSGNLPGGAGFCSIRRGKEGKQIPAASHPWRDSPVIYGVQCRITFQRNSLFPKSKYLFKTIMQVAKYLSLEVVLLLNYVSQLRALAEVLVIHCSDAVRTGEGGDSRRRPNSRSFHPPPRPWVKTLKNTFKALRAPKPLSKAPHGVPALSYKFFCRHRVCPSQISRQKKVKAPK